MTWGAPQWLWLALLAPLATAAAWWLWRRREVWLRAWASRTLWSRLAVDHDHRLMTLSAILLGLTTAGLTLALAQPRWGTVEQEVERQGVDIVFVLDSSLSMAARDVQPSRIDVAQQVIRRLVQELPGNRVALVQVEGDGIVLSPLTIDAAVIDLVLETVATGTLPTPGTNLSKSLQLAIELFPEGSQKHRVIVLLSDGEDHAGGLDESVRELTAAGVTLHALGIGTPQGGPIPVLTSSRRESRTYKKDEKGQVVISKLEVEPLQRLAQSTQGRFETVTSIGARLEAVVETIQGMEKRKIGGDTLVTQEERFQWALFPAVLALFLWLLCDPFASAVEEDA